MEVRSLIAPANIDGVKEAAEDRELSAEGVDYETAVAALRALVPAGQQLQGIRTYLA